MSPEYNFSLTVKADDGEGADRISEFLSSIQGVVEVRNLGKKDDLIDAGLKEQVERGHVSFGDVLRILRERRGLDQKGLARLTHLSREHISRLECGLTTAPPRISTVERLASALGLNLEDTSYLINLRTLDQKGNRITD